MTSTMDYCDESLARIKSAERVTSVTVGLFAFASANLNVVISDSEFQRYAQARRAALKVGGDVAPSKELDAGVVLEGTAIVAPARGFRIR